MDAAGTECAGTLEAPEERGLARAVATHEGGDLATAQGQVDAGDGDHGVVLDDDVLRGDEDRAIGVGRGSGRDGEGAPFLGASTGIADGQGQGRPASPTAELNHGRGDVGAEHHLRRISL